MNEYGKSEKSEDLVKEKLINCNVLKKNDYEALSFYREEDVVPMAF